jgi:serine/threonine-protein kinase
MIGRVLGKRYEILDRVGGGGMALVYKGHDILLNRKVAVKVLREQYVFDEEFIRRFRREAQSAASLSHPNVVSIYDVGQEGDTHFIVMEYIEGKTLNEWIKEKAPMQVEEAIRIASQICDALDHAHQNRIIHRDIKPHNILIGKNGRVKVTDFGIARAADSSQITQTGSVVGSVHYFSPEHAKGTLTGAQSDLYSLGIVLYQMLTGKLPFLGESPISVALKHLQEDVQAPRKVNPLIPQSVENIILKSMRKKPEERYQSAKEMLADLETCLSPERRNEPKIVFQSDADDDEEDDEKTRIVPAIRGEPYPSDPDEENSDPPAKKRKWRWLKPVSWTILFLLLMGAMWTGVKTVQEMLEVPEVEVPTLIGQKLEDAEKQLAELQLQSNVILQPSDEVAEGIVMSQSPEAVRVKINNTVTLYVSQGPKLVPMPNWKGELVRNVLNTELPRLGIQPGQVEQEEIFSNEDPGTILKHSPAENEQIDPKKVQIKLTVSKGREQFEMPNLIGLSEEAAEAQATLHDLKLEVQYGPSYKQPKGLIFLQHPYNAKDLVAAGTKVTVYVSTGPPPEAKSVIFRRVLGPAQQGKESTISIKYSDATGDNIDWGSRKIKEPQTFMVNMILSPEKDGTVEIFRDGERLDVFTVPYKEAEPNQSGGTQPSSAGTGGGSSRESAEG